MMVIGFSPGLFIEQQDFTRNAMRSDLGFYQIVNLYMTSGCFENAFN
jgi:hypothetical protein